VRIPIGVPAHNQGRYLAETLDSLINQSVPLDEKVVSDNRSTDRTAEVLRRR
jgi:glycosyltransferase involved in cell wall biosynthesis